MVATRSSTRKSNGLIPQPTPSPASVNGGGNGTGSARKRGGAQTNGEHESKRQKVAEPVDKTRWRLKADGGRHTWHYLDNDVAIKEWPQSYADKWYLDLPLVSVDGVLSTVSQLLTKHRASPTYPLRKLPSKLSKMA